jgi:uncharacterized protein GlcG (DUF336 family)
MNRRLLPLCLMAALPMLAFDPPSHRCAGLPTAAVLKTLLTQAPSSGGDAGGLFHGTRMWAALVNKDGELCAVVASTNDPRGVWPGSQAIAKAKAYTANAFSLDDFSLPTARLYTFTQPGHSLNSLGQSNLFNPEFLATPGGAGSREERENSIAGGLIFFGGGMPLYKDNNGAKVIVGGLGVSGDTSCTDHEIAKRVRNLAGLNPAGGALADDIVYIGVDPPSPFGHPTCLNTWRNGTNLNKSEPLP